MDSLPPCAERHGSPGQSSGGETPTTGRREGERERAREREREMVRKRKRG